MNGFKTHSSWAWPLALGVAAAVFFASLAVLAPATGGDAGAAQVTPTALPDTANQTCNDFEPDGANWIELKVDPPGNGPFTDGTLSVTITNFNGKSFDWTSNIGVDAVFAKAGAGGSHLYVYNPESIGDTALSSPGDAGNAISHIAFCYDIDPTATPTPTATNTPVPTSTPTSSATPEDATNTPTPTNTPSDGATDTPTATNTPDDDATNTPTPTNTPSDDSTVTTGGGAPNLTTPTRASTTVAISTVAGATIVAVGETPETGVTLPSAGSGFGGGGTQLLLLMLGIASLVAGLAAAGVRLRSIRR